MPSNGTGTFPPRAAGRSYFPGTSLMDTQLPQFPRAPPNTGDPIVLWASSVHGMMGKGPLALCPL